ncbi:MAG: hypothetical protein NXI27_28105 [Alphaproteobacteria bacterium]|nr:hypothetical protein [Alphaproteobacteria bacterium]
MPEIMKTHVKTARIAGALLLAASAFALPSGPASADDNSGAPYQVADSNNLPTRIPGLGTFSGGISAKRFKGNGIYFSIDGNDRYVRGQGNPAKTSPRPGAKIIDMQDAQHDMDCDNPGDVCVIRP